jgi:hypothetical protein
VIRLVSIAFLAAGLALADAASESVDLLASMAAALSEDNVPAFMKAIDSHMEGRGQLQVQVTAMLAQADSSSQIEIIENEGDDRKRTLAVDWTMQLKRKGADLRIQNREQIVHCTVVKDGKKWRVTAIEPVSLFAPPNFQ